MSKVCLCGHGHIHHMGADRRGRCTGTQMVSPSKWPEGGRRKPDNFTTIEPERWEALLQHWRDRQNWTRVEKAEERGFVYFDCTCPMYHEVELGQVKVHLPYEEQEKKRDDSKPLIIPG